MLEVGCGHGVAASLVCERLGTGRLTAIDRSRTMIEAATKRNREHISSGRAVFEATTLEDAQLGADRFDKVFAVHVAAFWRRPADALPVVRRALAANGALYLFNQAPGWKDARQARSFAEPLGEVLAEHGLAVDEVTVGALETGPTVCVRARVVSP